MPRRKKTTKSSTITKASSKKGDIQVYTRKKHIGNLRVLARRWPVRFQSRKKSVLRMLESNRRNSTPDEINLRLRGCRHGTPYRPISPNDGESYETEVNDSENVEDMLNRIVELQLTAARLQGKNSLSKIVHMALDYGIQNGIIINTGGPRRGNSRRSDVSIQSLDSVTSQLPKDSNTNNVATMTAWGGRSYFRVADVIGKLLTYLKPPITLSVKKSTVSEDASTQCSLCDVSTSQSELTRCGRKRRAKDTAVNEIYKTNDPALTTYNSCSEKCSTHASLESKAGSSCTCTENNSYTISGSGGANEHPVNVNVKIPADYVRATPPPVMKNNRLIVPNKCLDSKHPNMVKNYDLFNYEEEM